MDWVDWRARTLAEQGYQGEAMQRLAETTRVEQRAAGVRLTCPGVIITDTGGVLAAGIDDGTDMSATARVTVDAAQAKGWPALVLEGPREYQDAVAREAQRAGIPCQMTPDVIAAIEREQRAVAAQARELERVWEQEQAAAARAQVLAEMRAQMHRPTQTSALNAEQRHRALVESARGKRAHEMTSAERAAVAAEHQRDAQRIADTPAARQQQRRTPGHGMGR